MTHFREACASIERDETRFILEKWKESKYMDLLVQFPLDPEAI